MKYVLISFYQVRYFADHGEDTWWVVGHRDLGDNDIIAKPTSYDEALKIAFSYGVPVIRGSGGMVDAAVKLLAPLWGMR